MLQNAVQLLTSIRTWQDAHNRGKEDCVRCNHSLVSLKQKKKMWKEKGNISVHMGLYVYMSSDERGGASNY